MKLNIDYSLCLVTDRNVLNGVSLNDAVKRALDGGCTMVQLREKTAPSHEFYEIARLVKATADSYGVPLIINDRVDIALAVDASGVHIGQSDLPAKCARRLIGPDKILGVSATNAAEAEQAQLDGADYIGVGSIFSTGTKPDAKLVSLNELLKIRKTVSAPVVAIGGISRENAHILMHTGIDGLAVVSAILAQSDIAAAARELKRLYLGFSKDYLQPGAISGT